jgi:ABC-2 type transport system ATP-binding protein
MDIVLKTTGLTKKFGKRTVVEDINLEVRAGEVFGFLGANGAGKTTTIKIILGLLRPDAGEITINSKNVKTQFESAMADIGGIVENPDMYGYLTGLANLRLFARMRGVSESALQEAVRRVGLEKRIKEKVKRYSLGMKQRLGVAQAIMHRPKVLILDEPTNGLDPAGIKELREMLKTLAHDEGIGILISSHLLSEMQLMCDRVGIIANGKLVDVRNITQDGNENLEDVFLALTAKEGGQIA